MWHEGSSEQARRVAGGLRWAFAIVVLMPAFVRGAEREAARSGVADSKLGQELFAREWTPGDPRCHGGDGLGPVYNATSCLACHNLGGSGGAGAREKNVNFVTRSPYDGDPVNGDFPGLILDGGNGMAFTGRNTTIRGVHPPTTPSHVLHPAFTERRFAIPLHHFATDNGYPEWWSRFVGLGPYPERDGLDRFQRLARNLRNVTAKRGAVFLPDQMMLSQRNAPPLFGLGLIDSLANSVLDRVAAAQPHKVRGRVSKKGDGRVGRFGWKAEIPTLEEFVFAACANELGLEVVGHHQGISPISREAISTTPDLTPTECGAMVSYIRNLPVPVALDFSRSEVRSSVEAGRSAFAKVGCATCHTPDLGDIHGIYSDLLLHDMGKPLTAGGGYRALVDADNPDGPQTHEWRTPPLWGFHDSGPYLHDGRAETLDQVVREHRGQAEESALRYFRLPVKERLEVQLFLRSMVAPGGDLPKIAQEVEADFRRATELAQNPLPPQVREANLRTRNTSRLQAGRALERMGKADGALGFYREIVRDSPGSTEARAAAKRIEALEDR